MLINHLLQSRPFWQFGRFLEHSTENVSFLLVNRGERGQWDTEELLTGRPVQSFKTQSYFSAAVLRQILVAARQLGLLEHNKFKVKNKKTGHNEVKRSSTDIPALQHEPELVYVPIHSIGSVSADDWSSRCWDLSRTDLPRCSLCRNLGRLPANPAEKPSFVLLTSNQWVPQTHDKENVPPPVTSPLSSPWRPRSDPRCCLTRRLHVAPGNKKFNVTIRIKLLLI